MRYCKLKHDFPKKFETLNAAEEERVLNSYYLLWCIACLKLPTSEIETFPRSKKNIEDEELSYNRG
jgi:hypothetical protein